jgi:hypothetical protein
MSEWGWVGFAYAVAYGSLAAFVAMTAAGVRAARNRLGEG